MSESNETTVIHESLDSKVTVSRKHWLNRSAFLHWWEKFAG